MNEENNICREGIVRAVNGDDISVEIIVSSACSGCHAKSICIPSDRRQEIITVKNTRQEEYQVGETVELLLETSAGNKAVILAYVLPLISFSLLSRSFLQKFLILHPDGIQSSTLANVKLLSF